mgnify:CR=1 FL=1|tara:strand:- start:99700 stop:100398 length:699 start_codon:yes stop_codon:yes gene_type:complete
MIEKQKQFEYYFLQAINRRLPESKQIENEPSGVIERLIEAYKTPVFGDTPRSYHTFEHVLECIHTLVEHREHLGLSEEAFDLLVVALAYHDIVYDTGNTSAIDTNEYLSAEFAKSELASLDLDEGFVEKVHLLIRQTDHKDLLHPDYLCSVIRDIDLSGMASDYEAFAERSENIRKEYAQYDDEAFIKGRIEFMEQLIAGNKLFYTDYFSKLLTEKAINNIKRHLEEMKATA